MTEAEPLICPKCGADLDVPEGVSVLRRKYCSSKLQLKETDSVRALAPVAEKLDKVVDHTGRTAEGIEALRRDAQGARATSRERWAEKLEELESERAALAKSTAWAVLGAVIGGVLLIGMGIWALYSKASTVPCTGVLFVGFVEALLVPTEYPV